jgi:O-acetyl-ADP-ribose deacetylase (regulator of RNase III)
MLNPVLFFLVAVNMKVVVPAQSVTPDLMQQNLLPRGSAVLTSSGALKHRGIDTIIHAAPGSMLRSDSASRPTLQGVRDAIASSLHLAAVNGIRRLAVPLIGGQIFLREIGVSKAKLADAIVATALAARESVEVRFVAYTQDEYQAFSSALAKRHTPDDAVRVVSGSILDLSVHGASAIVNAANMEVQFGGGLSGAIGSATGRMREIESEAQALISDFYRENKPAVSR